MAAGFCGLFVAVEFRERVADAGVDVGELCAAAFGAEGFVDLFGGFAEREALREIFARVCDVGKVDERVGAFCTGCVLCFVPEFFFLWVGVVAVVRIVVRGGNTWLLLLLVLLGGARITAPPKDGFLGEGGTYSWGTTKRGIGQLYSGVGVLGGVCRANPSESASVLKFKERLPHERDD